MQTACATAWAADADEVAKLAQKKLSNTKKLALCGVLSSLQVVILYLSSVFNVIDLTLAAATVFVMIFAVLEIGGKYPFIMYAVVSLLSLLILPQKFSAVVYALFFGWYPMAKMFFERFNGIIAWVLKILTFNASFIIIYNICISVLGLEGSGDIDTSLYNAIMLILGNIAFLMFDIMLKLVIKLYKLKLRKQLGIDKLLK